MTRGTTLPLLLALTAGAVGGWGVASGKFELLLKAEQSPPSTSRVSGYSSGVCSVEADKLAAITAHN